MTTAPALQVQVPGLDFTELAKQAIAGELTKALIGSEELIQKIVVAAMTEKVSSNGTKSSSSYENKITFIEWLSHSMIREAVKQAMTSRLEALRPLVEKEVDAALKRQSSKIAKSLAEGFAALADKLKAGAAFLPGNHAMEAAFRKGRGL